LNIRLIPRLDIKGPNLVKGIHFEGLRVLGKPEDFARYYYENGADELIYMDAVASLYERNSLLDIVERTSKEIFIPLCVGGGLRTIEDIRKALRAGADKVSLNTAAIKNPNLIYDASRAFGSSTIVISIEAIKKDENDYEAYIEYGRQETGVDVFEWAKEAEQLGAGELMVTSINHEGIGQGIDLNLTRRIAKSVSIPIIAGGGIGDEAHVKDAILEGQADAIAMASILHYNFLRNQTYDKSQFTSEGNIEFLQGHRGKIDFSIIQRSSIPDIKKYLIENGIAVRNQVVA
jgi:cyclase